MMGLLHKLVCKVSKVLKNQKILTANQRKLAEGYNADHLNHPIELGSFSGSDSDDEPEGEEAFDILAPQVQEDPHSKDEEMVVAGVAGGSAAGDDEDDEDGDDADDEVKSESDEGEGDEGGDQWWQLILRAS